MKNYKNFRISKTVFASLLILALIIRIVQLFTIVDFNTGFFTNHSNPLVTVFYALTIIGSIGLIIVEFISKDCFSRFTYLSDNNETRVLTNKITGVAQIVLAALIIVDSKAGINTILECKNKYGTLSTDLISEELGGKANLLVIVFGVLSAITLVLHAICALTNKHFERHIPIVTLLPVFWSIMKVIKTFGETASYIKQSELFVEIFAFTFAMIAFLGFGRAVCNIGISESGKFFIPSAFISSIFSLMAFVYGMFTGKITDNVVFAGLFIFFISLVLNFKAKEINNSAE